MRFLLHINQASRLRNFKNFSDVFTSKNLPLTIHHLPLKIKHLSFILLFLFSCKSRESRTVNTAFIHWKSRLELTEFERNYCYELKAKTLYLRLFDVDFNASNTFAEPIAESNFNARDLISFDKIIPTIFITNRTLTNIEDAKIDSLSTLIFNKLARNTEGSYFQNKIDDILIDCDWTRTTKDKYFHLIRQLKAISNKKITATIRLHQIKFKEKTGIPPADRGLLMAYNTSDLSDPQTVNSILNIDVLTTYISSNLDNYPLKLDVALPIFSWGILKRDGQAVQLIPNFSKAFLSENKPKNAAYTEGAYFENTAEHTIEILKNGYYNGIYLYADDVIKIEEVSVNDLNSAADLLSQHLHNQQVTISFFSLDSANLKRYDSSDLLKSVDAFK